MDTMFKTRNKSKFEEGEVAKTLEKVTANIPSDVYLWSSIACMGVSLTLKLMGKNHVSLFVGQWAPSLLIIGLYNKLVKVEGHDQYSN
jgi:riboflavin synthase alpha subunit